MAYTDTPLAPQRLKDSQPLIRANFQDINTLVNIDHYTFGSPDAGEHKKVTLPDQGVAPAFAGNDLGLFAQIPTFAPLTGVNELFVRLQDGTELPMTGAAKTQTGWTYLPSGIIMKWGITNVTNGTFVAYPVAANIPAFAVVANNPFIVQLTLTTIGNVGATTVGTNSLISSSLGFSARVNPAGPVDVMYLAIGR